MANLVVGSGVLDAMNRANDVPRGSERYEFDPETGEVLYSITQGRDAIYTWSPSDGVKRLPLSPA